MRVAIRTLALSVAAALFCSTTQSICAQGNDPIAAIQQKLQERIVLATLDANGEIVTAGSVITLRSGSLQMCATTAPAAAGTPVNSYKNGRLSAGMFSWNLGLGLMKIDPNSIPMHTAVAGEKFWIVHYNVMKNNVQFKIWTDPDSNNLRYWTWLEIPFDKKQVPSPDQLMNTLAEVLAVEPVHAQQAQDESGQQAAQAPPGLATNPVQDSPRPPIPGQYLAPGGSHLLLLADGSFTKFIGAGQVHGQYEVDGDKLTLTFTSTGFLQHFRIQGGNLLDVNTQQAWARSGDAPAAPTAYQEIAPPPTPVADAPPPTVALGQTMDQVTTGFGQPLKLARIGVKVIFYYKDMKVTFTNGKVSNVE
jgi:hypothetical protein